MLEETVGLGIKVEEIMREQMRGREESWKYQGGLGEGGEWGLVWELVSVCNNCSSRSLLHSGTFGFSSLNIVAQGWACLWLPYLLCSNSLWGRCMSDMQTWVSKFALGLQYALPSPWLRWLLWPAKKVTRKVSVRFLNITTKLYYCVNVL